MIHQLIEEIDCLSPQDITNQNIEAIVRKYNFTSDDIQQIKRDFPFPQNPNRIPLYDKEVNIYLITWPCQQASSVHEHLNFGGVIKILSGSVVEEEFEYNDSDNTLSYIGTNSCKEGDVFYEQEQGIHKVINPSSVEESVTLHLYFPPHRSLKGCRIFDLENGTIATLGEKAANFSWTQSEDAYEKVEANAFKYIAELV